MSAGTPTVAPVADVEDVPAILRERAADLFAQLIEAHRQVDRLGRVACELEAAMELLAGDADDAAWNLSALVGVGACMNLLIDIATVISDRTGRVGCSPLQFDFTNRPEGMWPATGWPLRSGLLPSGTA